MIIPVSSPTATKTLTLMIARFLEMFHDLIESSANHTVKNTYNDNSMDNRTKLQYDTGSRAQRTPSSVWY